MPALAPALVGVVFVVLDHPTRAFVLFGLAGVAAVLVTAGVDLVTPMGRLVEVIVRWVTNVLSWSVGVVVFVPAWAWSRVRGRDPLRHGRSTGWNAVDEVGEVGAAPVRSAGRVRSLVGLVVLVLLADLALGVGWNRLTDSGPTAPTATIRLSADIYRPGAAPAVISQDVPLSPLANHPAMGGADWSEQYYRELWSIPRVYWPFALYRPLDFRGEFVNVTGWERHSRQRAAGTSEDVPTIAFFGGSAMFGEGQRDDNTIASAVARLADADGLPVEVRNFGQRGWVMWQEMILYEQLLASGLHVDISVFYDGFNDMQAAKEPVTGVPTHFDLITYAERLAVPVPADGPSGADLSVKVRSWWLERSAVYRSVSAFADSVAPEVGATRGDDWEMPAGHEDRAAFVYRRTRDVIGHVSESHVVQPVYFWQPQARASPAYERAARAVAPGTIDLSQVLSDREDTFLDDVHTNEAGASLVASAMWEHLRPLVLDWHER